jgi:hypothetical protein
MTASTSDTSASQPKRQLLFDRLRAPIALLFAAAISTGAGYFLFLQSKTEYYTDRDARLIARAARQVGRSVTVAGNIIKNAASLDEQEARALYKLETRASDEQRLPWQIFGEITTTPPAKLPEELAENGEHRYATRGNDGLRLHFDVAFQQDEKQRYASAQVDLQQLLKPLQRNMAGIFDAFFILDSTGEVIYQARRGGGEESGSDVRLVRLPELTVRRTFEKAQTLKIAELMSVSRQLPIQLGDNDYQLFSVPLASTLHIEDGGHEKAGAAKRNETWVVCGLVPAGEFRARSLRLSATLVSVLGAVVLLVIFSWPYVKTAMSSAQSKTTLFDVILLGLCGVLATAVICLAAADWLTYHKLEQSSDEQLAGLAKDIEAKLDADIATAVAQLDAVQTWAGQRVLEERKGDVLADPTFPRLTAPLFQTVSLIDEHGKQRAKLSTDRVVPPLAPVATRTYFSAPLKNGTEYISVADRTGGKRRLTIDSVRSNTTGQTEVVFSRAIDEMAGGASPLSGRYAVIAMSSASSLSVMNAIVPEDFGYAIIDADGTVLFHSKSERNKAENFFAETNQNPKLRGIVSARQSELLGLTYWGDDYRAYVHPLRRLPWTLITFREKDGLRGLNTEALLTTMLLLVALHMSGLLLICVVLLLRPRYRAAWLWPDPNRVNDYGDLAIAYLPLLGAAGCLITTLDDGALVAFPFLFIPFVMMVTYLYIRGTARLRSKAVLVASIATAIVLAAAVWHDPQWENAGSVAAKAVASIAVLVVLARAALRTRGPAPGDGARERQTALPLAYVSVAALLLLVVGVVPTVAFFKAAYDIEVTSYVKFTQIRLAQNLQGRWWHLAAELSDERGSRKSDLLEARWTSRQDLHYEPGTNVDLRNDNPPALPREAGAAPPWFEAILPAYSEASVNTRELLHDRSADGRWEWRRDGSQLTLVMRNADPVPSFTISSALPSPVLELGDGPLPVAVGAVALLLIVALVLAVTQFIARRVFLVDVVNPLWLSRGFLGLRHVICYPCDDDAAARLFAKFKKIDFKRPADVELAESAPQSFPAFAPTVFLDHLGYEFATAEAAKVVRGLLERLKRNSDRTIVIRPTTMGVIAHAILEGNESAEWKPILSSFVWVNATQIDADQRGLTFSGSFTPADDSTGPLPPSRWLRHLLHRLYGAIGFGNYFEQLADTRAAERAVASEIYGDPYLQTIVEGLESVASGRDQVLDEIGERAEEYYTALWNACSPGEQLALMQIAQTGLVNGKTRKEVRRHLARGLLRRDPQIRIMNETFRRFVCAQAATSSLSQQLEEGVGGDAWNRFRLPFAVAVLVVLLFFFGTQRELFDSSFAVISGMTVTIPALLKILSAFGERGAAKAA